MVFVSYVECIVTALLDRTQAATTFKNVFICNVSFSMTDTAMKELLHKSQLRNEYAHANAFQTRFPVKTNLSAINPATDRLKAEISRRRILVRK